MSPPVFALLALLSIALALLIVVSIKYRRYKKSEARFRRLSESATEAVILHDGKKVIDANAAAIDYARKASHEFSQITFLQENIVEDDCRFGEYDVIMCSLVLHHFDEETHLRMIRRMKESGVKAILINDLQRSALAWSLFQVVSRIFSFSHMARYDGLISIRKSFTRQELALLMKNSGIQTYSLSWKWAFRYQLIALIS